jgi:hypothetical protein
MEATDVIHTTYFGDPGQAIRLTRLHFPMTYSAQWSQHNNGILRKVRYDIPLHQPTTNRSKSNPRHLSRQLAAQGRLAHLQPRRTSLCLSGQQAAQDRLTRLQPCQISVQLQTASCPGWTHLPAAPLDHSAHLR